MCFQTPNPEPSVRRSLPVTLAAAVALAACSDTPVSPLDDSVETVRADAASSAVAVVDNAADAGPGSLRAAIARANASSSVQRIIIKRGVGTIALTEPVVFDGGQRLRIDGNGAAVNGSAIAYTAESEVTGEADPAPSALQFVGGGDLIVQDLAVVEATGHGVYVEVPSSAGNVSVFFTRVALERNGMSGLWVDDQVNDSDASVTVRLNRVSVVDNGFRPDVFDYDGVRVNEGGKGDLRVDLNFVTATGNAGDGVEVDERGYGDVWMWSRFSTYNDNGTQPQNTDDLEDGLDADEIGPGSIYAYVQGGEISRNQDEGFDLDEEGTGDIRAVVIGVTLRENQDDNVSYTEDEEFEEGGDVIHLFHRVVAEGSMDGDGIKLEEFGPGSLKGSMSSMELRGNDDEAVQYEEVGEGDLEVLVTDSDVADNAGGGLQVEQKDAGSGIIRLRDVDFDDNGDGPEDDIKDEGVVIRGY